MSDSSDNKRSRSRTRRRPASSESGTSGAHRARGERKPPSGRGQQSRPARSNASSNDRRRASSSNRPGRTGPSGHKERRSLSPARTPGAVSVYGPRELCRALSDALTRPQRDSDEPAGLTHGLHTYPARMHPATARALLTEVLSGARRESTPGGFLDPFCGSGTTLVEARRVGWQTMGVDANPLAVAIARAKTWTQAPERVRAMRDAGRKLASDALAEGRAARRSNFVASPERQIPGVDPVARNRKLKNWFAPHVRRELESLAGRIDAVRAGDAEQADILMVILSSLLYKVSRRTSDTDERRIERRISRGAAARLFAERTELLYQGLLELGQAADAPSGNVIGGDARHLDTVGIADGSIDAILSSPPYAGTYEYADHQQLRLDFLGLSGDKFRAVEMGARSHFQGSDGARRRRARRRYVRALSAAFVEMARACRPGALAAIMLGDSVAGERAMWAQEVMERAVPGEHFKLLAWAGQARPKLGKRERDAFGERDKREYIFVLQRRDGAVSD